jgi:hypothetical protein
MDFSILYNYYKAVKKTNLYEWCTNGNMEYLEFFNYKENYNFLLNNFGQEMNIKDIPEKGNYNGNKTFKISKGLNFAVPNAMYKNEWGINSPFVIEVKNIFKKNTTFVTEEFISIPKILKLPGLEYNTNIIPLNFFRQGIQFDYIISHIYSKYKCNIILEIGGGLGNMAHFQKKYNKNSKYILLDIPHTLLLQYSFLSKMGYNVKLLEESELININTIIKNDDFDILLILPHHISKIDNNSIDLIVNFDSLAELNDKTVIYYLDNISRISKYFYTVNKTYNNNNIFKAKMDQLIKNDKCSLLECSEQVYGSSSDYFFWIALSSGYISFLYLIKDDGK